MDELEHLLDRISKAETELAEAQDDERDAASRVAHWESELADLEEELEEHPDYEG